MSTKISGKTIVVTGASAGLGRAIVREFAKHGVRLGLIARGREGLEGTRKEVEKMGSKALAVEADVSDAQQMETAARQIEDTLGPIDIWINNAMVSVFGAFKNITSEEFKRVTEVTYLGQVYGTREALKSMSLRNKGTIILIGSALAYRGIPLQSAYCGAKHGIHGFFESLRSELIHDKSNIHLCMIQMPAMNTPQFDVVRNKLPYKPRPMGVIYEPEVAAKAVLYVARHPQRETHVGYTTIESILGNKFCPGYMDHYLAKTGYKGQQTSVPADPNAADNLWDPLKRDHGAHGAFDAQSKFNSSLLWIQRHKWLTVAAGIALSGTVGWLMKKKKSAS